jgi:hypothetical protein
MTSKHGYARTATCLRELQRGASARFHRRDDLHV